MAAIHTGSVLRDFATLCGDRLALKRRVLDLTKWLLLHRMESYRNRETRFLLSSLSLRLEVALPLDGVAATERFLDCSCCEGFMTAPVCLPCGHSLCRTCLDRLSSAHIRCPVCREQWPKVAPGTEGGRKVTLILTDAVEKWYPERLESCRLREEGNELAGEGLFSQAVKSYCKALETGYTDHRVLSNRSLAYLAMEDVDKALDDAESCCRLRPSWAKAHFRRAAALEHQGQSMDALVAYLLCLHFGGSHESVVKAASKLLDRQLSEFSSPVYESEEVETSFSSCGASNGEALEATLAQLCTCTLEAYGEEAENKIAVESSLVDQDNFECVLCTGLLYCPVTAACGHSFCQSCLSRSFDHSPLCPVCRSPVHEMFLMHCQTGGRMPVNVVLDGVIRHLFREAYLEKASQVAAELKRQSLVGVSSLELLPVFVCSLAYPGLPCPLHVFEPCYRLLIRRCLNSESRRFGMCHPERKEGPSYFEFGTVLFINSVEHTQDGRALVTTTGERRFQIETQHVHDGYNMASVKFIVDKPVIVEEEIASLRALQLEVYEHAKQWLNALPFITQTIILRMVCCPLPGVEAVPECCPNGPTWVWWFVNALPATPEYKVDFLKSTSLKQRLLLLKQSLPLPRYA